MDVPFDPDGPAGENSGIYGLPHDASEARVHVIPVPFDATTSYRKGAAGGPRAVFEASKQVELFDVDFEPPYQAGIHMLEADARIGELNAEATALIQGETGHDRVDAIGAELNGIVRARTEASLAQGKFVVILGGDHSVPFGAIEASADRHPGLGILHFDAHADLRRAYQGYTWSHASILFNVLERIEGVAQVVQCGVRDLSTGEHDRIRTSERVHTLFDLDWRRAKTGTGSLRELVRRTLDPLPEEVYVTFDIDGLEPSLCPNTGTPVPGGFDWHEALMWLEELVASGRRIVGLDLDEVCPGPAAAPGQAAGEDSWDAIVGARLLYKLIGAALSSQDPANPPIH